MRTEEIPMSIQPFSRTNRAVQSLPKHLLQFAVDQRYEEYTPVDHAVWRFIMRQNIFFLKDTPTKSIFRGCSIPVFLSSVFRGSKR